jgi:hypothetical protein
MKKIILLGLVMISVMVSVTGYAGEEHDRWVEKQMVNEQKNEQKTAMRDKAFVASPIKNFFLGSLNFKATYGLTNASGTTTEGAGIAPVSFKSDESVWETKFGYFDKPILRDIYLAGNMKNLSTYRKNKNKAVRWALLDAFKLNIHGAYGKTAKDEAGTDNFTTEEKFTYYVGISYELPLSKFGDEFIE